MMFDNVSPKMETRVVLVEDWVDDEGLDSEGWREPIEDDDEPSAVEPDTSPRMCDEEEEETGSDGFKDLSPDGVNVVKDDGDP